MDFAQAATLTEVLRANAAALAERTAVTLVRDPDRSAGAPVLSYAELDRRARGIAAWLQARFPAGERVLLVYPVGLDFVTAFAGCAYAGMIAVPAPLPGDFHHQRRRVEAIARDAAVAVVFTDSANDAAVAEWMRVEGLGAVARLATDGADFADPADWEPVPDDPAALLLLQYTSGSTGDPKGVTISHRNLLHNVASFRRAMGFSARTRFGGWIPLYHDMGLMAQLLPALLLGSDCVLMTPNAFLMRPHLWLRTIDAYGVAYSAAPNFAFELCCRRVSDEQLAGLDLSRWEYATNGSEPVQAATLRAFAERFAPAGFRPTTLCPAYGMAEATVFVACAGHRAPLVRRVDAALLERHALAPARPEQPARELVSCGVPHGCEVRIVDPPTGTVLAPGRIGEIWLRGASVSSGYWRNPRATEAAFGARTAAGEGPFLRTGDLGVLEGGELYVTGRIKEMLIVHGRNIYPQDVEHELRAHFLELSTRFGAVFTVAVPGDDEAVVVAHEIKGRFAEERLRELAAGIRQTVMREFGLRAAGVVLLRPGSVRRTTSGKIQRAAMRELFLAGALPALHEELEPAVRAARRGAA